MEIEPIQIIASGFIGFISGYFSNYLAEKGKNKAQLEDIKRLTEERKQAEVRYELAIAQRKYAYEDKRAQYFHYFNLIDQLNADQHQAILSEFLPLMSKYTEDYLQASGDKEQELIVVSWLSNQMQSLIFRGNESQMRFRRETNAIKLIAGERVLKLIELLHKEIDLSFQLTSESLTNLAPLILVGDIDALLHNPELSSIQLQVSKIQEQLIAAVRSELSEI